MKFTFPPNVIEYLRVQCGDIASIVDAAAWHAAYERRIEDDFRSMFRALPLNASAILDVAGGMSGLSARLAQYYRDPLVAVLDGRTGEAVVDQHRKPFNNATCTQSFLKANGVKTQKFYDTESPLDQNTFDLVVSTRGWCFHLEPSLYARAVYLSMRPGATLIVDLRTGKPDWEEHMIGMFGKPTHFLRVESKYRRLAYRIPA